MCDCMEEQISEVTMEMATRPLQTQYNIRAAYIPGSPKFSSTPVYAADAVFGSPTSVVDLSYWCRPHATQDETYPQTENKKEVLLYQDTEIQSADEREVKTHLLDQREKSAPPNLLECLTDDVILHIADHLDVKSAVFTFGMISRRSQALIREWFPWRCMTLSAWNIVPNHRKRILEAYLPALSSVDSDYGVSLQERTFKRISLAQFLGSVGWYNEGQELLASSIFHDADVETRADWLYTMALVKWRAQQARQGGDEDFLWGIVDAAVQSVNLRRNMTGLEHRRKLALTLEVLAENAACYGHCIVSMELAGEDTGVEKRENIRRMTSPFEVAEMAAKECVALWQELGDAEKLADAWAAAAAVDFYTGQHFDGALAKLSLAQEVCSQARLVWHPTHALVLFNLAYMSLVAFHRADGAARLFAESLAIRERMLGVDHPFTAATRAELAACQRLLRRLALRGGGGGVGGGGGAGGDGGDTGSGADDDVGFDVEEGSSGEEEEGGMVESSGAESDALPCGE